MSGCSHPAFAGWLEDHPAGGWIVGRADPTTGLLGPERQVLTSYVEAEAFLEEVDIDAAGDVWIIVGVEDLDRPSAYERLVDGCRS